MRNLGLGIVSYFSTHNFLVAIFIFIGLIGIAMMMVYKYLNSGASDLGFLTTYSVGGSIGSGPECIQSYIGMD